MKHPGKTPAQRRVLDAISCGDHAPYMTKVTREKMLSDGLIVELSPLKIPFFGSLCMEVRQFDMPLHIHLQWCAAVSEETPYEPDGSDAPIRNIGSTPSPTGEL